MTPEQDARLREERRYLIGTFTRKYLTPDDVLPAYRWGIEELIERELVGPILQAAEQARDAAQQRVAVLETEIAGLKSALVVQMECHFEDTNHPAADGGPGVCHCGCGRPCVYEDALLRVLEPQSPEDRLAEFMLALYDQASPERQQACLEVIRRRAETPPFPGAVLVCSRCYGTGMPRDASPCPHCAAAPPAPGEPKA